MWPKITIVTPSFNQAKFLEETIQSVISQNYPNLEYIIIDGGSTDGSIDIIKRYEKHLAYWVSEPDRGQSHAINKGLEKATGNIFNWVNSDDLLAPEALLEIGQLFMENAVDVICGYLTVFSGTKHYPQWRMKIYDSIEKTLFFSELSQQAMFYRMDVIREIGKLDEGLHYCMDLGLWYSYLTTFGTGNIYMSEKNLAFFRLHEYSKSIACNEQFGKERFNIYLSLLSSVQISSNLKKKLIRSAIPTFFDKNWNISRIKPNIIVAYAIEKIIEEHFKKFVFTDFLTLFLNSLKSYAFPRHWRFYLMPFRWLKWQFTR